MKAFTLQHEVIEVMLDRFVRQHEYERVSLKSFVEYLHSNKEVKRYFSEFGKHRLTKVVSHGLETGAYSGFRLSYGEGIVRSNYDKGCRWAELSLNKNQQAALFPAKVIRLPLKFKRKSA